MRVRTPLLKQLVKKSRPSYRSNPRIIHGSNYTFCCHLYYRALSISGTLFGSKPGFEAYSTCPDSKPTDNNDGAVVRKMNLAESLASLVDESTQCEEKQPRTRRETKRFLELSIKKRVKEHFKNGKYKELMAKVVADPRTLMDAYNSIKVDSNIDISAAAEDAVSFETLAKELSEGSFFIKANTFSISTRGANKEVLVLPNLKLRVVQEAMRIVLEVVYKPHFSKISHGGRSGRGHFSALRFICKEIVDPNWWFTVVLEKKMDGQVLDKLISVMEEKIEDPFLYSMIKLMLDEQVLNLEFGGYPKSHGLPQEGVLSSILMNIYLDLFDREFYQMSMKFEALGSGSQAYENGHHSRLRSWFRRNLKGQEVKGPVDKKSALRVYSCRFMDEIFFAVSGSEDVALELKSHVQSYLNNVLYLGTAEDIRILPCDGPCEVRFLGTLVRRTVKDSPASRSVHKLKDKVKLFASSKQEIWDAMTVRVGKKWLSQGLRKVKESEINHLADSSSHLSKIACYRKAGMETDHWYKQLMKIWIQDVNAKAAIGEEAILSKFVAEPSLPSALRDSYYEFQKQVQEYISAETASLLSLIPISNSSHQCDTTTEVMAPVNIIKKCLFRYRVTNGEGYGRASSLLLLLDSSHIIEWYSGIVRRWLQWYRDCHNFSELKLIISNEVRKSCVKTLALKYRMHETEVVKRFDLELTRIPSTPEIEHEMKNEMPDSSPFDKEAQISYGTSHSGLCLLSLARIVSQSRPCNCFVIGCMLQAPNVYSLHVMERQRFPGWKTGFASCIHPSLNRRRVGLCKQHLKDLFLGNISLQSVDFGSWK